MTHAVASIETSYQLIFQSKQSSLQLQARQQQRQIHTGSQSLHVGSLSWAAIGSMCSGWIFFDDPQILFFRFTCGCVDWRRLQTSQMIGSVNNKYMQNLYKKKQDKILHTKKFLQIQQEKQLHTAQTEGLNKLHHD